MKKQLLFLVLSFFSVGSLMAETVSNVRARQTGQVIEIFYDLEKTSMISVFVSIDGKPFEPLTKDLTGDVGKDIPAGENRKVVWSPLNSADTLISENVRFIVHGLNGYQYYASQAKRKTVILAELSGVMTDLTAGTPQNFGEKLNYGLMVGQVYARPHVGWFVNFRSNYRFYSPVATTADGIHPFYTGGKKTSALMVSGGIIGQILEKSKSPENHFNTFGLYMGMGWGRRNVYWETTDGSLVLQKDDSAESAFCMNAGLIGSVYGLTLKAGVNTFGFRHTELELGIGWMF